MNSQENSTGFAGDATVTCAIPVCAVETLANVMDRTDGLIQKSQAAKHLSALLLNWIDQHFGPDAGEPGPHKDCRTIILHDVNWQALDWLVTEVHMVGSSVVDLVDELDESSTSISNATYEARKAVAP